MLDHDAIRKKHGIGKTGKPAAPAKGGTSPASSSQTGRYRPENAYFEELAAEKKQSAGKSTSQDAYQGARAITDAQQGRSDALQFRADRLTRLGEDLSSRVKAFQSGGGTESAESLKRGQETYNLLRDNFLKDFRENDKIANEYAKVLKSALSPQIDAAKPVPARSAGRFQMVALNDGGRGYLTESYGEDLRNRIDDRKKELQEKRAVSLYAGPSTEDARLYEMELTNQIEALENEYAAWERGMYAAGQEKALSALPDEDLKLLDTYVMDLYHEGYRKDEGPFDAWVDMNHAPGFTGEAAAAYMTLTGKYGKEKLESLTEYRARQINAEIQASRNQKTADYASSGPWQGVAASAASVVTNALSAPMALPEILKRAINPTNAYETLDVNAPAFSAQNFTKEARGGVSNAILGEDPENASFGRQAGNLLYQTLMSGLDSAVAMTIGGKSANYLLGATAATNAMQDITERGGTLEQAVTGGIAAGVFECIFEKYSIGNFYKLKETANVRGIKDLLLNMGKSALVNASEEGATELANVLYDSIMLGDISNVSIRLRELMAAGMTESEAKRAMAAELGAQIGESALSGALMGLFFGGVGSLENYVRGSRASSGSAGVNINSSTAFDDEPRPITLPTAEEVMNRQAAQQSQPPLPQVPGMLPTAEQDMTWRRARSAGTELERSGILAGAQDSTIAEAQRISRAIGRDIAFYNEAATASGIQNGYYNPGDGKIYVNAASGNPVAQIIAHEMTHSMELAENYGELADVVLKRIGQTDDLPGLRRQKAELYAKNGIPLRGEAEIDQEIVAEYVERHLLTDEASILELTRENRTLGERILAWINRLLAKLGNSRAQERAFLTQARDAYAKALRQTNSNTAAAQQQTAREAAIQSLREEYADGTLSEEAFYEALDAVMEEESAAGESMLEGRFSISESFVDEIDAWDGRSRETFRVGTVSDALKSIGVKDNRIVWHSGKIAEILRKHRAMDKNTIKQVPQVLEHPIVVLKSKNVDSRILMFGEIVDNAGKPVTAVLELMPTNKDGEVLNLNVIASAYGKDNIKNFIQRSDVLYLDPDKNRTDTWLQSVGLQLPSDTTIYGSIGTIAYQDGKVKIAGVPYEQYMQDGGIAYRAPRLPTAADDIRYSLTSPPDRGAQQGTPDAPYDDRGERWDGTFHETGATAAVQPIDVEAADAGEPPRAVLPAARDTETVQDSSAQSSRDTPSPDTPTPSNADALIRQYGAIPKGEKPAREIELPRATSKTQKVMQTARTIAEAGITTDQMADTIQENAAQGAYSDEVYADRDALADAETVIRRKGWEQAYADWTADLKRGRVDKTHTALGAVLYNHALQSGHEKTAAAIASDVMWHERRAAQAVQGARLFKKLTPDGQLYGIVRSLDAYQEDLKKRYGRRAPEISIPEALQSRYRNAADQAARDAVLEEIYQAVAEQVPSTFLDKYTAWRYFSMLFNPTTHVRNIIGNAAFIPQRGMKNLIAAGLETAFLKDGERTKSIVSSLSESDRELLSFASASFGEVRKTALGVGKYQDAFGPVEEKRAVFKTKWLEGLRKFNGTVLDTEDVWFSQYTYTRSLAAYLKANGVTAAKLAEMDAGTQALVEKGQAYAIHEAQKATYRDANTFSDWIAGLGNSKYGKVLTAGYLPFKRTPANIAVRAFEYSPLGLVKSLAYDLPKVYRGDMSAAQAIDNVAAGLSGSLIFAFGALLKNLGLLYIRSGDDDRDRFEELTGHQNYSLVIGDKSFTIDWLSPLAISLFSGAEFYGALASDGEDGSTFVDALFSLTNPLLHLSMLSSLEDALANISYSENKLVSIAVNALLSYAGQSVPTVLSKLSRTIDPVSRRNYTTADGEIAREVEYALQSAGRKLPGLYSAYQPYINEWGEAERMEGNALSRAMQNFISPGYLSTVDASPMEQELKRLYEATGDAGVFPSTAARYIMIDGQRRDLSAAEYTEYAVALGTLRHDLLTELVEEPVWQSMTDEERVNAVANIYAYANAEAKSAVSAFEVKDQWMKTAENPTAFDMTSAAYIGYKSLAENMSGMKTGEKLDYLLSSDLRGEEKQTLYRIGISDSRDEDIAAVLDTGLSFDTYLTAHKAYTKLANDETVKGSMLKATEFARWVKAQGFTGKQASAVRESFRFYSQVPGEAKRYESLLSAGLSDEAATSLVYALADLEPEPGKAQVSDYQRYEAIIGSGLNTRDQISAIGSIMGTEMTTESGNPSGYAKLLSALEAGVELRDWLAASRFAASAKTDYDANGKEVKGAKEKVVEYIDSMDVSDEVKDALYLCWYAESGLSKTPWHRLFGAIQLPTFTLPEFELPELPKFEMPEIMLPPLTLPKM